MSGAQTQPLSPERFLLVALNLLHRAFGEASRAQAKALFRTLQEGAAVALSTVEMEDGSRAAFGLSLDQSEFRGRLNYGGFRASLDILLGNISTSLKEEKPVPVFTTQGEGDDTLFGITALTVEGEQPNVLMLAARPDAGAGGTVLRLMYMDPAQFAEQAAPPA